MPSTAPSLLSIRDLGSYSVASVDPIKLQKDVDHATSIEDLRIALHQVKMARSSIDTTLERHVSSSSLSHSNESRKLNMLKARLGSALSTSHDLLSTLSSASFVASSLAVKVRTLDLEQSRVKASLQYVTNVIDLKRAVQGVHHAMDVRDWERAANFIYKTRLMPPNLVTGNFAKAMVPSAELPDFPEETLADASTALGTIFLREFGKAAAEKNMEALTRYFTLLPLIGKEKEGLQVYAKFICGIITAQSRQRIQARSSADSPMFYALAMTRLFENIATIVNQHAPIVERHYGKGRMAKVLEKTQDEADSQGGLIIDTLWDERNLPRVLTDIQSYAFPYLVNSFLPGGTGTAGGSLSNTNSSNRRTNSPGFNSSNRSSSDFGGGMAADLENVDLKRVGDLIRELSVILNRWSLYRKFLGIKWTEYSGESNFSSNGTVMHMPEVLTSSNFEKKVSTKLIPAFQSFATFAFRRSLEKALQLEETPDVTSVYSHESPLATSLVEDCMYMLKILLQQSLDTGEIVLIKPVIAAVRRILESDFIGAMQRKLRDEAPRAVSATATFNTTTSTSSSSSGGIVSRLSTSTPPPGSTGSGISGSSSAGGSGVGASGRGSGISGLHGHEEVRLHNFLVYLNNLYVGSEYSARIVAESIYEDSLPFETDAADVRDQLQAFVQSFKHRCDELSDDGIQVAYSQVMSGRIRHLANNLFKENDYMVSPSANSSNGGAADSQSLVNAIFNKEWNIIKSGFPRVMAPPLYAKLMGHAAGLLSRTLEKRIWSLEGRVNELGAIQLDRDVSRVIATVSSGQYSLREKFVRVAQIVMIIGLDDVEEEEGVSWVLSDVERQRARLIRVERRELNI